MKTNAVARFHHTIGSRAISERARFSIVPKLDIEGSTPTPTYDSTASYSTICENSSTSVMITMCMTFGMMCRDHDLPGAGAERLRRLHVVELAQLQRLAAHETAHRRELGDADDQAQEQQLQVRALDAGLEELRRSCR